MHILHAYGVEEEGGRAAALSYSAVLMSKYFPNVAHTALAIEGKSNNL